MSAKHGGHSKGHRASGTSKDPQRHKKQSAKSQDTGGEHVQWIDGFNMKDAEELVVTEIKVAGHTANPIESGSTVHVNHWVIYLAVSQKINDELQPAGSVRLDMVPTGGDNGEARLIVSRLAYVLSNGVVHSIQSEAQNGLYVCHVIERLFTLGRQRFRYGRAGLECRHWTLQCVADIRGWFGQDFFSRTSHAVKNTWSRQDVPMAETPAWTEGTVF